MHSSFLQKFELYFARILLRKQAERFACLLHELCLQIGPNCKWNLMFACRSFEEVWAVFCQDSSLKICRNIFLSFAWIIPGKWTILQKQFNVCIQAFCRSLSYILQGFYWGNKQKDLPAFCMNYACKLDRIANGT